MDPLGNKLSSTDEFGNPVHHHTGAHGDQHGTTGQHGVAGHVDHNIGGHGGQHGTAGHLDHQTGGHLGGAAPGVLRRSGSSSSSSSEDDGMGGRRKKKGVKDKIKEKLPGGHKDGHNAQLQHEQGIGAGGLQGQVHHEQGIGAGGVQGQEKKGIMEKIKEKLPGSH